MNQLETLLNSLIQMGWKPFGNNIVKVGDSEDGTKFYLRYERYSQISFEKSLRELVSHESGLWQFCEESGLLHEYYNWRTSEDPYKCYWTITYEYRLLESALVPEEELGQFLLDNIKVKGK